MGACHLVHTHLGVGGWGQATYTFPYSMVFSVCSECMNDIKGVDCIFTYTTCTTYHTYTRYTTYFNYTTYTAYNIPCREIQYTRFKYMGSIAKWCIPLNPEIHANVKQICPNCSLPLKIERKSIDLLYENTSFWVSAP